MKGKKTPESSNAVAARVAMLEATMDNSSNESLFQYEKPESNNRHDPALDKKGSKTRQSHIDSSWLGSLKEDSSSV